MGLKAMNILVTGKSYLEGSVKEIYSYSTVIAKLLVPLAGLPGIYSKKG